VCCEGVFVKWLHEHGLRLTPQRQVVLSVLHKMQGHVTVEEIHAWVREENPSVDLSTVYRTLELLQDVRLVGCLDLGDGLRGYELLSVHGHHHHLRCRACGKLIRLEAHEVQPLLEHFQETYGFETDAEHLVIPGLCQECREAQAESERAQVA